MIIKGNSLKEITITSWICEEKQNPYETISILATDLLRCPVIVHEKQGDMLVGMVSKCEWDENSRHYRAQTIIYSDKGASGFSDTGFVDMFWNEENQYCVPFALVVERK